MAMCFCGTFFSVCIAADKSGEFVEISGEESLNKTPVEQLAEVATLENVLRLTVNNSPAIRAARHKWQAATHKRAQEVALPDPRLEATYFVRQNFDQYMLGVSQEIPYPGKLLTAGRIADKEAQAAYLRYQAAIRNALADAKEAYFELYYIDRAQVVSDEVRKLYERYAALGVGGNEVAKPKLPETFRAESQRAQLSYDVVLLREMRQTQVERLRAIMGMSEKLTLGSLQDVADPLPLAEDLDKLEEIARAHNQEFAAAGVEVEKSEDQLKLARRAAIPNFTIGANYAREVNRHENDPVGVTFGISLPIWAGKYRAMKSAAEEMQEAAKADQEAQRLALRSDLAKEFFSLRNSDRLVKLYRDTLLPQARQAQQSAEELYRKGDANLTSLIETTAAYHNFQLARLRATADFYQNVARIERTLGTALRLQPAGSSKDGEGGGSAKPAPSREDQK